MTKRKNNKRALTFSILSLLLCVTMLVGSTFAWFTDTASTSVNTIQAGTLDIQLLADDSEDAASLEGQKLTFQKADGAPEGEAVLFEPGATYELQNAWLYNAGDLHAKYQVVISGVTGDDILANVLDVQVNGQTVGTLAALIANGGIVKENNIAPKEFDTFGTVALHMQETAGNDYQGKAIEGIAITVNATQAAAEFDSFGNQYDAGAAYDKVLSANERRAANDAELAAILEGDLTGVDTIYLNGSFGATTLPVGTNGVSLVGQNGATMASLNINGAKNVVISGLTFDAAKAVQTHVNKANGAATAYTASVYDDRTVANNNAMSASENVTIKNCTFSGTATANAEGGYTAINIDDNGAGTRANGITIEGCKFNCNAFSYVYIQGIHENSAVIIKGNTFGGEGYSTTWTAVAVQQLNSTHVQITNNTFNSFNADEGAVVVSTKSGAPVATATITGNTFNGTINDGKCVICIRRCNSTGHTISGNTYNITDRTLTDSSTEVRTDNNAPSNAVAIWYRQTQS